MASGISNCPPSGESDASPKHSNGHASPLDMLRRFHRLQADRVAGYALFEEAFNNFVSGSPEYDFNAYKHRVNEITISFTKISEEIIHIRNSLSNTHHKAEIAAIIEKIQELEEAKLGTTADYQIRRKEASDVPDDDALQQHIANLKKTLDDLAKDITESIEDLKFESEELYAEEIEEDR